MRRCNTTIVTWLLMGVAAALVGCGSEPTATVSFRQDVNPILEQHCVSCHTEGGPGFRKTGLRLDSYEHLMAGRVITPGDTSKSPLLAFIHPSSDPGRSMPLNAPKLAKHEVDLISAWVAQGAKDN